MSSRKRTKGKERKAKAAAQVGEDLRRRWESWALWGEQEGIQCKHGCLVAIPESNHPVSQFLNTLWADTNSFQSSLHTMEYTFRRHREVWQDDKYRKMAISIMICIGTNIMLKSGQHMTALAPTQIALLEHYDGKSDFQSAMYAAAATVRDISGGGEREITRFFFKRIPCSCLKNKYSQVRKDHPNKKGTCDHCIRNIERETLMVCSRCRLTQYCSRACQVANWPKHKSMCDAHYKMSK